jgi:hypothetical protein
MCNSCGIKNCGCNGPITIDYNKKCGCNKPCSCNSGCATTCDVKCDNTHKHYGNNIHFCKEIDMECQEQYGVKKGMDYDSLIMVLVKKIDRLEKAYGGLMRKLNIQESELANKQQTFVIAVGAPLPVNSSTITLKKYDITIRKDAGGVTTEEFVYNGINWIKTL